MHGLKRLFDGQRLRIDRVHPAIALLLVFGVLFGQRVAIDQIQNRTAGPKMAITVDVASKPSTIAKRLETKAGRPTLAATIN